MTDTTKKPEPSKFPAPEVGDELVIYAREPVGIAGNPLTRMSTAVHGVRARVAGFTNAGEIHIEFTPREFGSGAAGGRRAGPWSSNGFCAELNPVGRGWRAYHPDSKKAKDALHEGGEAHLRSLERKLRASEAARDELNSPAAELQEFPLTLSQAEALFSLRGLDREIREMIRERLQWLKEEASRAAIKAIRDERILEEAMQRFEEERNG